MTNIFGHIKLNYQAKLCQENEELGVELFNRLSFDDNLLRI